MSMAAVWKERENTEANRWKMYDGRGMREDSFLLPEAGCDVREFALLYAIDLLVGGPDVQRSAFCIIGAYLQVVEITCLYLWRQFAATAVPCCAHFGVLLHPAGQTVYLGRILVAAHQAEARHSDMTLQHV